MRENLVRRAIAITVACLVLASPACDEDVPPPQAPRPNVLIILTDDQREGLEVMPATRKWFIKQGRKYPNAWVTTPLCCPARATVMTGRYAHNHNVLTNDAGQAEHLDQQTTLQFYLQEAGYRTGLFGKYLNKWDPEVRPPDFDSNLSYTLGVPFVDGEWNRNGKVVELEGYSTHLLGDAVVKFIEGTEDEDDRPWFAMVTPPAPHLPVILEEKYKDAPVPRWKGNPAVRDDTSDKPPYLQSEEVGFEIGKFVRTQQLRSLRSVDDMIDRLMNSLGTFEERANTLAFFVSDNGYSWGEFGYLGKSLPYRFVTKVPLLARGPGVESGTTDNRFVTHVDIVPTILDATGADGGRPDGRSLLDLEWDRDRLLLEYWKTERYSPPTWGSLRTRTYQYIRYLAPDGSVTFEEFYDLTSDPWQTENLLADGDPSEPDPERVDQIRAQLEADLTCSGAECP